jgi:cell division protein FtsI/penicillin-binding protein 2
LVAHKGDKGDQGITGSFGTHNIGTVNMIDSDEPAEVTITTDPTSPDTAKNFIFEFDIPKGPTGFDVDDIRATATNNAGTATASAAINEGKLNPDATYYNSGSTDVDDRTINNAYGTSSRVGTITFRKALDYSLNTGSIEVLRYLGGGSITKNARSTLYNYLHDRFGLGQKTGFELNEATGLIISPEDVEGNAVRYANMTFGQGMNLTMLQVAAGFSSLINGGDYYTPTVIAGTYEDGGLNAAEAKQPVRKTISAGTSAEMRKMLQEVRSENGGANDLPGYRIGVKTGTAETLDQYGNYTSKKTNASALGFGGLNSDDELPKYVVMVRLDGETLLWGSQNAVPVFTEISNYLLQYLRMQPK